MSEAFSSGRREDGLLEVNRTQTAKQEFPPIQKGPSFTVGERYTIKGVVFQVTQIGQHAEHEGVMTGMVLVPLGLAKKPRRRAK